MPPSNKTCKRCGNTFTTNANLTIHTNRKTPCKSKNEPVPKLLKYKCERCHKMFSTNQNLNSHLGKKKTCEIKDPEPEEIELRLLFEQLKEEHLQQQEENEHLKIKIDKLENQPNTTNNTTNNIQNNNNNNSNNVTINVYGKEDTSHITDAMVLSCFDDFDKSIERYWGMRHFSKKMPGNHNLYISNMRDGYMMVFNTKKWNIVNKEVTLKKMYYEIKEILSNEWDRMRNKNAVASHIESIYPRFIEYEIDDERELLFQTASCDKMACMAYNNRDFPMNKKKQWDKEQK